MLDSRCHRTPDKTPENGAKTMRGAHQLQWLKKGLGESKAAFNIIACGSETHPDPQFSACIVPLRPTCMAALPHRPSKLRSTSHTITPM